MLDAPPKIAFCTTCKGRVDHIKRTLPANITSNIGDSSIFVLLDYNSNDGLDAYVKYNFAKELASGKLVYYQNPSATKFKMAHGKNMAHRCALLENAGIVVNLDADNLTGPGFADYIRDTFDRTKSDPQEIFLWSRMIKGKMERGVSGRIAVTRNAFLISGGYDEKYETHSPDDKDFNMRLRRLGYCAQEVPVEYLRALNHNDKMRFKEYPQAAQGISEICQISRVVNNGSIGCGTVFRNFDPAPIKIEPLPTRIFGIGMHKTATTSLHTALKILGFRSGHWENAHWAKAVWVEMKHLGRSATLERFYALCDTPIPQLYREIDAAYPGSKFILTVRSEDAWLKSVEAHFDKSINGFAKSWNSDPFTNRMHREIYGMEHFYKPAFLKAYRDHNADVLDYFKDRPQDLLVMEMNKYTGWQALCDFLGTPVPAARYPVVGTTAIRSVTKDLDYSQ